MAGGAVVVGASVVGAAVVGAAVTGAADVDGASLAGSSVEAASSVLLESEPGSLEVAVSAGAVGSSGVARVPRLVGEFGADEPRLTHSVSRSSGPMTTAEPLRDISVESAPASKSRLTSTSISEAATSAWLVVGAAAATMTSESPLALLAIITGSATRVARVQTAILAGLMPFGDG